MPLAMWSPLSWALGMVADLAKSRHATRTTSGQGGMLGTVVGALLLVDPCRVPH